MERDTVIVAGLGFRAGADLSSLRDALNRAAHDRAIGLIATAEDKARSAVFERFATETGLPVCSVTAATMSRIETITNSAASRAARQTGSVAEACALAAAGEGARLIQPRVISDDGKATCALAETPAHTGDYS